MEPIIIRPGLWRWTAPHPDWKSDAAKGSSADWPQEVGCVLYESSEAAIFIDPLVDGDGQKFWRWADERCAGRAVVVLTTIDFHRRSRDEILARYTARSSHDPRKLPAGVEAIPLAGAGETVFWLAEHHALIPGDRIIGASAGDGLRMCPQSWLRSQPSGITVAELRELLLPLLTLPIELVLVSHGEPILADGRQALAHALADEDARD